MNNDCWSHALRNAQENNIKPLFQTWNENVNLLIDTFWKEQEKKSMKNPTDTKPGFIVIHQNVGNLECHKAEMFCDRVKDNFTKSKQWLEFKESYPGWNFILLPSRSGES